MREEDFLRVQQTSFAQGASPLTPEQADAMEADAWAVAQDAAHRALRASQKAELKRVDLEAYGQQEGSDTLAERASCQIVTAQVSLTLNPTLTPTLTPIYTLALTLTHTSLRRSVLLTYPPPATV